MVGQLQYFDLGTSDVQGKLSDQWIAVEHQTFDNAGFGFGLTRASYDFKSSDKGLLGTIDLDFDAAMVYLYGRFGQKRQSR